MKELFLSVVQLSLSASWLIMAVIAVRYFLRKSPKYFRVFLWSVVAIRLICPLSIESVYSLMPDRISSGNLISEWKQDYVGEVKITYEVVYDYKKAVEAGIKPEKEKFGGFYVVTKADGITAPDTNEEIFVPVMTYIWLIGAGVMAVYGIIGAFRIRKSIETAVLYRDDIYLSGNINSPFLILRFIPFSALIWPPS